MESLTYRSVIAFLQGEQRSLLQNFKHVGQGSEIHFWDVVAQRKFNTVSKLLMLLDLLEESGFQLMVSMGRRKLYHLNSIQSLFQ